MQEEKQYLYRASCVVPVCAPVIRDGAILTEDGRVKAVGSFRELKRSFAAPIVDYSGYTITPSLLNCHAHLELSYLSELGQDPTFQCNGDITGWIRKLLSKRHAPCEEYEINDAALFTLAKLYTGGCGAVIDIGNRQASRHIGADFKTKVFFFLELLGLSGDREQKALADLEKIPADIACTAHALYSSGPELLRALKKRATDFGQLFPVHVAESAAENEFLMSGSGNLQEFLEERGVDTALFQYPRARAVRYLDDLGVLDQKTLCVHGVDVGDDDIDLLAARKSAVCLCPGSNRYLGVGKAPVQKYLDRGVKTVLGTDSLASNSTMSMWNEMRLLREDHPGVEPEKVFHMATLAGAKLLGLDTISGAIAPGVSSSLLAVKTGETSPDDIFDFLTTVGEDVVLEWIE